MSKNQEIHIALVGNPNVGKSVIFNYLTNSSVEVSNYPGTTIEISSAEFTTNKALRIYDTPGVYGISDLNEEEIATLKYALEADLIVNVVSALTLHRDLFLTKQLADLGKPMLIVLNQCDEAKLRKVQINTELLSSRLEIHIIQTVAIKGQGLPDLQKAISESLGVNSLFQTGQLSPEMNLYIEKYLDQTLTRTEALILAEKSERENIYQLRRKEIDEILVGICSIAQFSKRAWLGTLLLNPWIGSLIGIFVLYWFLYQFLGIFIAGNLVNFLEQSLFQQYYEPLVREIIGRFAPIVSNPSSNLWSTDFKAALGTCLAGDYGILTLTITYLYGLLLPLVAGFYLGLAILEDSGYLPRLAVLMDGILTRLGMNGRAIIPLILGGGCVTMATVTTRLLSNKKEKLITMILLGLTIPCSAQLGVIQGLLSNIGGLRPWLIWSGTLIVIFVLVGSLMNRLIPGPCGNFISDIPPLRLPRISNIWQKTFLRTKVFLEEAAPAFFVAAALVSILEVSGLLQQIILACEPIVEKVLLLPKEVTLSFILGMIRRDFGAFGLLEIPMSDSQLITACTVLTLFVPCIATLAVMIKERNLKTALSIWISSWILALGVGAILARVL